MLTRSLLLVSLLLGACAAQREQAHVAAVVTVDPPAQVAEWRGIATTADQNAIATLPRRWADARQVAERRFATRLRMEGPLLDPGVALPLPALSPGRYRCRLVRLGGELGYVTYKPDVCEVDGDDKRQSLTKQNGATLPGGWLYADEAPTRLVFLGASRPRPTEAAPGYGTAVGRDVSGVVERVDAFRWRFVVTSPSGKRGSLEIYELVPIAPDGPPRVVAGGDTGEPRHSEARTAASRYTS